jgi:hypothetical protein
MSKFKSIIDAAKNQEPEELDPIQPTPTPSAIAEEEATPKRRGRPAGGKRNDPDFEQVTAYVRKDTHRAVKIALLQTPQKMEFSELVDDLLSKWLQSRNQQSS